MALTKEEIEFFNFKLTGEQFGTKQFSMPGNRVHLFQANDRVIISYKGRQIFDGEIKTTPDLIIVLNAKKLI